MYAFISPTAQPQVMLQPLGPLVLDSVDSQVTLQAYCMARGIPRPYITWSATTMNGSMFAFDPSSMLLNISGTYSNGVVMSTLTLPDGNIRERGTTLTCTASNAVANVSDSQMTYFAGNNFMFISF